MAPKTSETAARMSAAWLGYVNALNLQRTLCYWKRQAMAAEVESLRAEYRAACESYRSSTMVGVRVVCYVGA